MHRNILLVLAAVALSGGALLGQAVRPGSAVADESVVQAGHEPSAPLPGPARENPDPLVPGDEPKPDPKAALNKVVAAAKTGQMVLVATVKKVQPTLQAQTFPPRNFMNVTLKDVTMLKGKQPENLTFTYSAFQGREFEPRADQKVVAVAMAPAVDRPRPLPGPVTRPGVQPGRGGPVLVPQPLDSPAVPAPPDPGEEMHSSNAPAVQPTVAVRQVQPVPPGQAQMRVRPPLMAPGGLRIVAMAEASDENVAAVRKALGVTSRPDGPSTGPTSRPADAAGWTKLFADLDWYKRQAGQERWFTGEVKAIKQDPNVATTLQRTSLYSLDKRTVYTGGRRVDALDALVGKVVTIRGKAVDMQLEGQAVREIWPGAVREVREGLHPEEIHPGATDPPEVPEPPANRRLPARPEPIRPPIDLD